MELRADLGGRGTGSESPSGWGPRSRREGGGGGRGASQLPPLSCDHAVKRILCLSEEPRSGSGSSFGTKP